MPAFGEMQRFKPGMRWPEVSAGRMQNLADTISAVAGIRGGPGVTVHRKHGGLQIGLMHRMPPYPSQIQLARVMSYETGDELTFVGRLIDADKADIDDTEDLIFHVWKFPDPGQKLSELIPLVTPSADEPPPDTCVIPVQEVYADDEVLWYVAFAFVGTCEGVCVEP